MSSLNSISSVGGAAYSAPVKPAQGAYDANAAAYGPATASLIGAATAVGDSVGTVVSFSAESLEKLGEAAKSGLNAVTGAIGEAATETGTAVGNAVDSVENAVSSVADGIGNAASSAAAYVTMGVAAGKQFLSELV